jgi:hypothetical protein
MELKKKSEKKSVFEDLEEILTEKRIHSKTLIVMSEVYQKIRLGGYDKDHPAIELLKTKSFESSHKIKFEAVTKNDL